MKYKLKIVLSILIFLSFWINNTFAAATPDEINLKHWVGGSTLTNGTEDKNNPLSALENSETDFSLGSQWWQTGIYNLIIRIARDLKNLFFVISWVYFLIIVIRLIFSWKTDEEVANFKKWIIWISVWIIVTQIAYWFVNVMFDNEIDSYLATNFTKAIIGPLLNLLQTTVGFIFIAIMLYSFFRMVTANGDEEKIKNWKIAILYAIVWFIAIKIATALVNAIYLKIDCSGIFWGSCFLSSDLLWFSDIIVRIINWMNSFIWLIVILLIIYAWFLTFTSGWDEEKLKKTKSIIIYIIIWLLILVTSYLILTFFIYPETTI